MLKHVLMLLFVISSVLAGEYDSKCPAGMVQTYVDHRNTNVFSGATSVPISIVAFQHGGGAVWLKRKIKIEPRFEIHLKVSINEVINKNSKFSGFAISLSGTTHNYVRDGFSNVGFVGLKNGVVLNADFYNTGNIRETHIEVIPCWGNTECKHCCASSSHYHGNYRLYEAQTFQVYYLVDKALKSQGKKLNYYSIIDKYGEKYSITDNHDYVAKLNSYLAWLGFSGYSEGNQRTMNMAGTFICEDTANIQKTANSASIKSTINVAETLTFSYTPRNNLNQLTSFETEVENVDVYFENSQNCKITRNDKGNKSRSFSFFCNKIGTHKIIFSKTLAVNGKKTVANRQIKVIATDPKTVVEYGHDGKAFTTGEVVDLGNNLYELLYNRKKTIFKSGLQLNFEITAKDQYGNDFVGENMNFNTKYSKLKLFVINSSNCKVTAINTVSNRMRLIFQFTRIDDCSFKFNGLNPKTFVFKLLPGTPNAKNSTCMLHNQPNSPTFTQGSTFVYKCRLIDSFGNHVTPKNYESLYNIKVTPFVTKIAPNKQTGGVEIIKTDSTSDSTYLLFTLKTKYMGDYKVDAKIGSTNIPSSKNLFHVKARPLILNSYTRYYTMYKAKWEYTSEIIYKIDPNGLLLLIDLTDSDNKTRLSTYSFPDNFNVSQISANFVYGHRLEVTPQAPKAEIYTFGGKKYVAIKYDKPVDHYILKNSYTLYLDVKFGTTTRRFRYRHILDIDSYRTCLCPFSPTKTKFEIKTTSFEAGNQYEYFKLILINRGSNIHNYRENITLEIDNPEKNTATLVPHKKIDGIYTVEINAKEAGSHTLKVNVVNKYNKTFKFTVLPSTANSIKPYSDSQYETIGDRVFQRKTEATTDGPIETDFNIIDYLGNIYKVALKTDVEVRMLINQKAVGKARRIDELDFKKNHYVYIDQIYEIGDYEIRFKLLTTGETYTFKYTKKEGSTKRESLRVIYDDNMIYPIGTVHSFDIYYYSVTKKNLVVDKNNRNRLIQSTSITVTNSGTGQSASFSYNKNQVSSDFAIKYYTPAINTAGKYKVKVKYDDKDIITFDYEIGEDKINAENSIFVAKTTTEKYLLYTSAISLRRQCNLPKFTYYYFNSYNKPIYTFTSNPSVSARLIGNGKTYNLNADFDNNNGYVDFSYSGTISSLAAGLYTISLKIDGKDDKFSNYSIYLVDDDDAYDSTKDYEIKSTYFPFKLLETTAGKKETFIIELKTEDLKRYNKDVDASILNITDTNKLIENKKAIVEVKPAYKKGQLQISITQFQVGINEYIFTFKDPSDPTKTDSAWFKPKIQTLNAVFAKLEVASECIKSKGILQDGTAGEIYKLIMTPKDLYNNIYTDFFNEKVINSDLRKSIISISHSSNANIIVNYNIDKVSSQFYVEFKTEVKGQLTIESIYFNSTYTQVINNNEIDAANSYAEVTSDYYVTPGTSNIKIKVLPKDIYNNIMDNVTDLSQFKVYMQYKDGTNIILDKSTYSKPFIIFTGDLNVTGEVNVYPTYADYSVHCTTCKVKVTEEQIENNKTEIIINDNLIDDPNDIEIDNSIYPTIQIKLYDKYSNLKSQLKDITVTANIGKDDLVFNFIPIKLANSIQLILENNNKEIRDKWTQIEDGNYKLNIKINQYDYSYTVKIENDRITEEESTMEVNNTLTVFIPEKLNIVAGQNYIIEMRQFGADGKRFNNWYEDISSSIKLSFSNNQCTNNIYYGNNPGVYYIVLQCTKSIKSDNMKITVNGTELEQTIPINVTPNKIKTIKITDNASSVSSNEVYTFTITPYDEYNNEANVIANDISYVVKAPNETYISSTIVKNYENNSFKVKVEPNVIGEYKIESKLLLNPSKFETTVSNYNAINSKLVVQKINSISGEQIYVHIIPYDDKNNYKAAVAGNYPYKMEYKHSGVNNYIPIQGEQVTTFEYKNKTYTTYVFTLSLNITGNNYFRAKIDNNEVFCESCNIIVLPSEIDLAKTIFHRYFAESSSYQELQNNVAEDNSNSRSRIRVYLKDTNDNDYININNINDFSLKIVNKESSTISCDFTIDKHNETYSFIDYIPADDNAYRQLKDGLYDLTLTYGQKKEQKNLLLKGAITTYDIKSEEEDLQKTSISDVHLSFEAGKEGYFFIQINSKKGLRVNTHSGYTFKIEPTISDSSFNFTSTPSGTYGVFIIRVYSSKAVVNNELKISVSSTKQKTPVLIEPLKVKMNVIPAKIKTIKIDPSCIKSESDFQLKDANTDSNAYYLTVHGYDEYDNENYVEHDTIKLNLNQSEEGNTFTVNTNGDGSVTYIYKLTVAGNYYFISEYYDLSKNERYLKNNYKLNVNLGNIDFYNSDIDCNSTSIEAGKKAYLSVTLKDNKNNEIKPNIISILNVKLYYSDNSYFTAEGKISNNKLIYSASPTKSGEPVWSVRTNSNEEILTTPIYLNIYPSEIDVSGTVYTTERDTVINNKHPLIISSMAESFEIRAHKYDIYGNVLSDKNKMLFNYAALTGNYMEDITLAIAEDSTKYRLNMPSVSENKTSAYTLNHLVKGYGYYIKLDVTKNIRVKYNIYEDSVNNIKNSIVELPVLITTNTNDTGYGNGPFYALNTEISKTSYSIPAGENDYLTMTFKNKQGLLFNDIVTIESNDEINTTKFKQIEITPKDPSLTTIYEPSFSTSTITIRSTLLYNNSMTILVKDKTNNNKEFIIPCKITHGLIPDMTRTQFSFSQKIITPPNNHISINFKLYDLYNNIFREACHEMKESVISVIIDDQLQEKKPVDQCEDSGEFVINRYTINYPPFTRYIGLAYYFNNTSYDLFKEPVAITINTAVDFSKSEIQCFKCEAATAGEIYSLTVSLFDVKGECYKGNYTTNIPLGVKITPINQKDSSVVYYYNFKSLLDESDICRNVFEWIYDKPITKAGTYRLEIFGKLGNENITIREFVQKLSPDKIDMDNIYIDTQYNSPKVGENYKFSLYAKDKYNNMADTELTKVFSIDIKYENGSLISNNSHSCTSDLNDTKLDFSCTGVKLDPIRIYPQFKDDNNTIKNIEKITINGNKQSDPKGVYLGLKFDIGNCDGDNVKVDETPLIELKILKEQVNVPIQCYDKFGNKNTKGNANIVSEVKFKSSNVSEDVKEDSKIIDHDNGTYTLSFIPKNDGVYTIKLTIDEVNIFYTKTFNLKNKDLCPAEGESSEKTELCPNKHKCIEPGKLLDCLDEDELCPLNLTHPFNCKKRDKLTENKCVKSFSECNCPENYHKCEWYQNQCVPNDRDFECPFLLRTTCKNKKPYSSLCDDGVCRLRNDLKPNKYVCPYGYYQCSDLTCKLSPSECTEYGECRDDELKCDDQSCAPLNYKCPSRVTCKNITHVVCPDGSCVENELMCQPIKCIEPLNYLCPSGTCSNSKESCPKSIVCGHTYSLCEDNVCRNDCRSEVTEEEA